eukprot:g16090.t1
MNRLKDYVQLTAEVLGNARWRGHVCIFSAEAYAQLVASFERAYGALRRPPSPTRTTSLVGKRKRERADLCALCSRGGASAGSEESALVDRPHSTQQEPVGAGALLGRLVLLPGNRGKGKRFIHTKCAAWTLQSSLGQHDWEERDVELCTAIKQAASTKCSVCAFRGATLTCLFDDCSACVHLPCALQESYHLEESSFSVRCTLHRHCMKRREPFYFHRPPTRSKRRVPILHALLQLEHVRPPHIHNLIASLFYSNPTHLASILLLCLFFSKCFCPTIALYTIFTTAPTIYMSKDTYLHAKHFR